MADRSTEGLSDLGEFLQLPTVPVERDHCYMMYPIMMKGGSKDELVMFLEEHNVETRDMLPLLSQPI